jgi:REP element-mobilizing transposase RayT
MPRYARVKRGEYCTYHIIQRGNERRAIFRGDSDKERFLETLVRMKEKYAYKVYYYCLMDNHMHLIINTNGSDISQIMKSINVSHSIYFNKAHRRCGHSFRTGSRVRWWTMTVT